MTLYSPASVACSLGVGQSTGLPMTMLSLCPPAKPPKPCLKWAAGFLDGEGCIHIARQRYKSSRSDTYRLGVFVAQNDLPTLEQFRDAVGVQTRIHATKRALRHRHQCYTLNYTGNKAIRVLELVSPYLVRKRAEAEAARVFWAYGRFQPPAAPSGTTPAATDLRESFYLLLRNLK